MSSPVLRLPSRHRLGNKMRKTLSGLSTLVLAVALLVVPAQVANAKSYSADGVEFSWKVPFLPAKYSCRNVTVNFRNAGEKDFFKVNVRILNKYGDRLGEALAPRVKPGDSGILQIQYCDRLLHGTKGYKFEVVTETYDYRSALSMGKFKFKKRR